MRSMASSGRDKQAFFLVLPALALLAAVLTYPAIRGVWASFYEYKLTSLREPFFIWIGNYIKAFQDPEILSSIWHTIYIVAVSLALEFVLGLLLALFLNRKFPARNFLIGLLLIPWMVAPVVAGLMWTQLLNENYGIVNYILRSVSWIDYNVPWLSNSTLALHVMILVDVWHETPFVVIILLAGLQGIDETLYEASTLDGAGKWQRFLNITLPLLKPAIALALLMRTMIAVRFFDIPWIMTQGGPAGATEVLGTRAYEAAFVSFNLGYGSTLATIILFFSLLCSVIYLRLLYRRQ